MALNVWLIVGIMIAVAVIGGGGMALLWILTRPRKMTWYANVYQLGEGIKPPSKDRKGNVISPVYLSDLRPYTKDVLERIEKAKGVVIYFLQKLKKATPPVDANCVEYWGPKDKQVSVLLDGESATLLQKGYDRKLGKAIFKPLSADRINMIKTEMSERKERIKEKKDTLQAITPWIVAGILVMGFVGMAYFMGNSFIQVSENLKEMAAEINVAQQKGGVTIGGGGAPIQQEQPKEVKKEDPPLVNG